LGEQELSVFPHARQLVRLTREWTEGKSAEFKSEARYFRTPYLDKVFGDFKMIPI
jgi:hypothetical protein